jgi:DNA-binding HxlR family transcriptional regulator
MRTTLAEVHCSIARTMEVLRDAWTLLILRDVFAGITRFDDLQEDLGLSRKILAARLDLLVTAGVLERRPYSERPPRHDYIPTDKGADLFGVVAAMMAWGDRWTAGAAGPPALIRHTACGRHTAAQVACEHCGKPLHLHGVSTEAGPGGRTGHGTKLLGPVLGRRRREAAKREPE